MKVKNYIEMVCYSTISNIRKIRMLINYDEFTFETHHTKTVKGIHLNLVTGEIHNEYRNFIVVKCNGEMVAIIYEEEFQYENWFSDTLDEEYYA